jgi:hypothetical protein
MNTVGQILSSVGGLGQLVCFILVLIQMFQRGKGGLGVVCIVLTLCCGIGALVAFIYGWVVSRPWNITTIMLVWTVAWILTVIGYALNPFDIAQLQRAGGL